MKLIWGLDNQYLLDSTIDSSDLWFGEKKKSSKVKFDVISLFNGDLTEITSFCPEHGLMSDDFVFKFWGKLDLYMDMFERTSYGRVSTYTDRRDYFFLLGHIFFSLLKNKKIEYAFFVSPPHFGVDELLADICEFFSISVYYGYQSLFENRFFILDQDYKLISSNLSCEHEVNFPDVGNEKLFYMNNLRLKKRGWWDIFFVYLKILLKIVKGKNASFALKKNVRQIEYQKNMHKYQAYKSFGFKEVENLLKSKNYIYFPLHLQPEMTTSNLGGMDYRCQMQAIKDLLKILPDNWVLVLKENPKQDWRYRSSAFFASLINDERILLVNIATPSKLLIHYSRLVATVSGTVGWEAIRLKKPVVSMGKSWFSSLYGVTKFSFDLDVIKLSNFDIKQDLLKESFDNLMSSSWLGVLDPDYKCLCSDFNEFENAQYLDLLLKSLPRQSSSLSF